ncbi:MAG: NADH-quinone oxidoreductase subunit I [Promethearchaeota archaeon]
MEKLFPQRFLIAKLSKMPILGKIVEKILNILIFEGVNMIYLPKDPVVRDIISVNKTIGYNELVLPSRIVETFIEKSNYRFIMDFCICRDANKCKNYPIDLGCLFLGEAVLDINEELGHLVSKEEAIAHIRRAEELGLVHMIGIDRLDSLWLNVKNGKKLMSICCCCECCCLWKMTPHLAKNLGRKIMKMPGVDVRVNIERCVGCGICTKEICFTDAISIIKINNKFKAIINENCRGCGRCVEICPQNAIEMFIEEGKYIKKSIKRISSLVDLS